MLTAAPLGACRVLVQAERAAALATDLGNVLSLLHRFESDCADCGLRATCQAPGWNAALDTAIRDIAEEWGLC